MSFNESASGSASSSSSDSSDSESGRDDASVPIVQFDHPKVREHEYEVQSMLQALAPHVVHAAIAPNFDAAPLAAAPTLQQAFDVSAPFEARARGAGAKSAALASDKLVPSGYALKLDGAMPIDSAERLQHTLAAWNQGLGTSVYRLEELPPALQSAARNDDSAVQRMHEAALDDLPPLISPTHRIALQSASNVLDGDHYSLFVTANDVPAARRLTQYTAARAASDSPLTLGMLADSAEYEQVLQSSAAVRDMLAQRYADAIGAKLVRSKASGALVPEHTTLTHYIARANDLSHGAHESLPSAAQANRESDYYVIYNNASDASAATRGAIITHGVLGGATLVSNADPSASADGGWHQPNFLSLLPATSGAYTENHTRQTALHASANERTQSAARARIAFHSDLGPKVPHPDADDPHNSMNDPYTTKWLEHLSPSAGDDAIPLDQTHYSVVSAQLPNISTLYASPSMLARIARHPAAPQNLPIALNNPVVGRIAPLYDTVIKSQEYPVTLDHIFRNTYEQEAQPGSFATLSSESALVGTPNYEADETLYADAEQYGLSKRTGAFIGTSAHKTQANNIDALRVKLAPDSTDFDAQTVLMVDRDLLRLITLKDE